MSRPVRKGGSVPANLLCLKAPIKAIVWSPPGGLELVRVRLTVADPANPIVFVWFCLPGNYGIGQEANYCGGSGGLRIPVETAVGLWNRPGTPYSLIFTPTRPESQPPAYETATYTNPTFRTSESSV
jgi:hypothetical protein